MKMFWVIRLNHNKKFMAYFRATQDMYLQHIFLHMGYVRKKKVFNLKIHSISAYNTIQYRRCLTCDEIVHDELIHVCPGDVNVVESTQPFISSYFLLFISCEIHLICSLQNELYDNYIGFAAPINLYTIF